jgi:hypothetical protein
MSSIVRDIAHPFGGVHARDRFVEQQQLRFHAQRARQLHALADAVREHPHRRVEDVAETDELGDLAGAHGGGGPARRRRPAGAARSTRSPPS